ncbi:hypothetical protein ASC77_18620 [Nocardioides sp. Root1257]|nr:hypothetical protein ASC77_18620 [Nocardioides sp. Root1257]KRC43195.1 hypothetical protein ASE24_19585 [Nocardioides sp. Root224]
METDLPHFTSVTDSDFWRAFERRLATKPCLSGRTQERHELVVAAYADMTTRPATLPGPVEYADTVYRLRYTLGPSVSSATRERLRQENEADALLLLAEGVSPELLGLAG